MANRRNGVLLALVRPLGREEGKARFQAPAPRGLKPAIRLGPSKEQMMEAPRGRGADRPLLLDEPELLARCRAGETAAFAALVERYRDRAYGLAFRLTRSAPDAEEVAQDSFLSAWRSLGLFRGDAAFSTWLYRIVWRKALDRVEILRNRGRREVAVDDPARVEAEAAASDSGRVAEGEGDAARLERLLGALSEVSRAVVTLYYYEDRSVADVAAALGIPEGTVKTHLFRARAALREGWLREERAASEEREHDAV